jgi:hypothetical protein
MHNRDIKKIAFGLLVVAGFALVIITNSLMPVESRQAFSYLGFGIASLSTVFLVETIRHEKTAARNYSGNYLRNKKSGLPIRIARSFFSNISPS